MILARVPDRKILSLPKEAPLLRAVQQGREGSFRGASTVDGIERLLGYRKVGRYPIFVAYGLSVQTVLNQWRKNLFFYGVFLGFAALALALIALLALRRAQREISAVQKRRRPRRRCRSCARSCFMSRGSRPWGRWPRCSPMSSTSPWPRRPTISAQPSACPSLMGVGHRHSSTRQASRSCAPARSSSAFVTSSPKASLRAR